MKLNISDIISVQGDTKAISLTKEKIDIPKAFSYVKLCKPVKLEGELESDRGTIYLSGTLTTEVKITCDRCMCEMVHHIETQVNESFGSITQSTIDLGPTIVETLLISLPMKALCHEECKGICVVCGENLNEKSCDCDLEYMDPRLENFNLLFENNKDGENSKEV